jgi:DNA-binding NtrC family response regulator
VDRVTLHGPGAIQVLLPEAGFEQAAAIARSVTGISAGGSPLRVGMAVYPEAGQTVDTLIERTWRAVQSTSESEPVRAVSTAPWREAGPSQEEGIVVGAVLRELMETAERVARSRIPVLLHGETGSGKEVLARFIHDHGPRKARRMVRVNCGSIPALLVESTLFGHERGSFTGAIQQQKGVFEEADGGTVFLDEIGELPPAVQVALLRVLETGTFCRVGSNRELAVDVRLIAATHRDLEAMVERGQFRADLLYRLNTMTLIVPPLRSRTDELEPLARRFLKVANEGSGRAVLGFTPEVLELFRAYAWPGNVRELRNVIERAVVVARGALIEVRDLPGRIQASGAGRGASAAVAAQDRDDGPVSSSGSPTPGPPSGPVAEVAEGEEDPLAEEGGELKARVQRYEARLIRAALEAAGWNRAEAAKALGLPLRTLAHKIKVLEIEKPSR